MGRAVAFFAATAAFLLAAAYQAAGFALTGQKWTNPPITIRLQLGASGPLMDGSASWDASAASALASWNGSAGSTILNGIVDPGAPKASGNNINNVFFSGTVYGSGWGGGVLAVTLSRFSGSSLVETDVLFNTGYTWNSYSGPLQPGGVMDFRRVALHEFGHVLGLHHPDQIGQSVSAIMNSTISNLATLTADDVAGVQALYGGPVSQAPIIQSQPASQTATEGDGVFFSVSVFSNLPVSYQWRKNSVAIPGATGASLTLNNVTAASAGSYTVFVSNSAGSVTSVPATLTVNPPVTILPPVITTQPGSQTVNVNANATFSVVATGDGPLTYLWEKDGAVIPGATSSSYSIASVQLTHAGNYRVIVSNNGGATASVVVKLTVGAPPAITTQPTDKTVVAGAPLSLTVVATGNPTPIYQWRKNGIAIAGATNATLTIASAQTGD
ncbi:MAG: immunoglobulin domain-containing protein, partial [Opitutaceae bacterium]